MFDKKTCGSGIKNENMSNKQLAEKLHKPIIRKCEKGKVHSPFIDNTLCADLADMWFISEFNAGIRFYYVFLTFLVNTHGLFLWKTKKVNGITNAFQKILDKSKQTMGWQRQ